MRGLAILESVGKRSLRVLSAERFRNFSVSPDSIVLDGQSIIIQDYLEVMPQNEGKVKKYIQEGRIKIGPWYTLPDLFPIEGESIIRNLLKGLRSVSYTHLTLPTIYSV